METGLATLWGSFKAGFRSRSDNRALYGETLQADRLCVAYLIDRHGTGCQEAQELGEGFGDIPKA